MSNIIVELKHVGKRYGDTQVLKDVNIEIEQGKFYTLLGPSGSGKTTILRAIAGFLDVSEGEVLFDGKRINNVPANQRKVNTVFKIMRYSRILMFLTMLRLDCACIG